MAMALAGCIGLQTTTISRRSRIFERDSHQQNNYAGKKFFEDKNYKAIIECLDGGYNVGNNLIQTMTDYNSVLRDDINNLTSCREKCIARFNSQSSLSSYNTTSDMQRQTVEMFNEQINIKNRRCGAIQGVIDRYQKQIDDMYPCSGILGGIRKHCQTEQMEKEFKTAYSPVRRAKEKLEKLTEKLNTTSTDIEEIDDKIQKLRLNSPSRTDKIDKQVAERTKKEGQLKTIKEDITAAENEQDKLQAIYVDEAKTFFKQCQALEEQRLNQIRETLIAFNDAIHCSTCSAELDKIYKEHVTKISQLQDSTKDVEYWAKTYSATD